MNQQEGENLIAQFEVLGTETVRHRLSSDGFLNDDVARRAAHWLGVKDQEAARLAASSQAEQAMAASRAAIAAERAAKAAEEQARAADEQARIARKALTTARVANAIAIVALIIGLLSFFHVFR